MCYYQYRKGDNNMPDYILLDDIIDEMIDNISFVKLNTYINVEKDK
jgi:hypothetical protein